MKTPQLLVLLSSTLVGVSTALPADRSSLPGQEQYASWDEVNVVAHGLLQLGQGLKEYVDKTKAQTRDIHAKLKLLDATVLEVERGWKEQEEALRARSREAEEREKLLAEVAEEVRLKVEQVKKQSESINFSMDVLEKKVEDRGHVGASLFQKMLVAQNSRIDQLVEKMEQQEDKLDKQSLHLQTLESKVSHKELRAARRRGRKATPTGGEQQQLPGRARDCQHLYADGQRASGVYTIQPDGSEPFAVFCDMTSEGGWTVIQKRHDGSQSFNQPWESYKRGFGSLSGEFWLGLEKIRSVSKQGPQQLRVELGDGAGQQLPVAQYGFRLDGEEKRFALHLEDQTASPSATTRSSGIPFSTADRDNDLDANINCTELLSGGWWFSSCGHWNPNGRHPGRLNAPRRKQARTPGTFRTWPGRGRPVKTTLLKIAPTRTDVQPKTS